MFNIIFAWLMFQYFFIKMCYCVGEPPLPAYPHLHTTVGLLNIISFRFLNLKLNFDSIYYSLSGKADVLKYLKFQSVRLMWLVLNQIWKKLKKTPKICKKILFLQLFKLCSMNGMERILVKSASLQTKTHTCVS